MHERHDLDLIAGYADGSLDNGVEEARRLVASCTACAEEYRVQREVRQLLLDAPAAALRDDERLRIREGALAAIAAGTTPSPAPERRRAAGGWTRRWVALGSVAAALLVLVGVAGSLGGLGGGGDADDGASFLEAADQPPEATTAAADEANREMAATAEEGDDASIAGLMPAESWSPLFDLGPITDADLVAAVENAVAEVEARIAAGGDVASMALTPAWFNDRERPVPDCFGEVDGVVVSVLTAEVDAVPVRVFLVVDRSGNVLPEAYVTDGCAPRPIG